MNLIYKKYVKEVSYVSRIFRKQSGAVLTV